MKIMNPDSAQLTRISEATREVDGMVVATLTNLGERWFGAVLGFKKYCVYRERKWPFFGPIECWNLGRGLGSVHVQIFITDRNEGSLRFGIQSGNSYVDPDSPPGESRIIGESLFSSSEDLSESGLERALRPIAIRGPLPWMSPDSGG